MLCVTVCVCTCNDSVGPLFRTQGFVECEMYIICNLNVLLKVLKYQDNRHLGYLFLSSLQINSNGHSPNVDRRTT